MRRCSCKLYSNGREERAVRASRNGMEIRWGGFLRCDGSPLLACIVYYNSCWIWCCRNYFCLIVDHGKSLSLGGQAKKKKCQRGLEQPALTARRCLGTHMGQACRDASGKEKKTVGLDNQTYFR